MVRMVWVWEGEEGVDLPRLAVHCRVFSLLVVQITPRQRVQNASLPQLLLLLLRLLLLAKAVGVEPQLPVMLMLALILLASS